MILMNFEQKSTYSEDLERATISSSFNAELWPLTTIFKYLPIPIVRFWLGASERINVYGRKAIERTRSGGVMTSSIFSKMLAEKDVGTGVTDNEMETDAKAFIVAGTDTTAATLTYFVWLVLKHPRVKERLQNEVSSLRPGFNCQDAENLKYLDMVIQETLRIYGAAPGSLPRVVPKGGKVLGSYFIPDDAVVSTQAFSIHRDESIFPNPLE